MIGNHAATRPNRPRTIQPAGCGASYSPGSPRLDDYSGTIPPEVPLAQPSYLTALGRGFAVVSTALNNTGHNCKIGAKRAAGGAGAAD